jgi:two-component system chemotaxis response regulator CheB
MTEFAVPAGAALAPLRVLIVDDSTMMRRVIAGIVESCEDVVIVGEAADGIEALEKAAQLQPDVILLDIEMPRLDGLGFLKEARLATAARVIVISSVAHPGSFSCREALELGARDVLAKPSGVVSLDLAERRRAVLADALRRCRAA